MIFVKNFQGVSYEVSNDNTQKEILSNLAQTCKDIKSKEAFKTSIKKNKNMINDLKNLEIK